MNPIYCDEIRADLAADGPRARVLTARLSAAPRRAVRPASEPAVSSRSSRSPSVPVLCNRLWPTRAEALAAPRGAIRLGCLPGLRDDLQRRLRSGSGRVHRRLRELAALLAALPGLRRGAGRAADRASTASLAGAIVEIGCGKGEFLAILCRDGRNRGSGSTPATSGSVDDAVAGHVRIVREHFSEASVREPARSRLLPPRPRARRSPSRLPRRRARRPRAAPGVRASSSRCPNGLWTLRDLGIWDVIYEHCSYFARPALVRLFERTGFAVERQLLDLRRPVPVRRGGAGRHLAAGARRRRGGRGVRARERVLGALPREGRRVAGAAHGAGTARAAAWRSGGPARRASHS